MRMFPSSGRSCRRCIILVRFRLRRLYPPRLKKRFEKLKRRVAFPLSFALLSSTDQATRERPFVAVRYQLRNGEHDQFPYR